MNFTAEQEETVNQGLRQSLPHHIKTELKHIDEHTRVDELYVVYNKLVDYAQSRFPVMTPANQHFMRKLILAGICKTETAWRQLISVLRLTGMPPYSQRKTATESAVTHAFRGTVGVRMPYIGGGSVVFSVAGSSSPASSTSY